ncbi:ammonium transporter AmtB-like domain-containing protein, partial [Baffinella frigidus]
CTNSLLAGLVAISSAAAVVSTWYAFLSGMGGGVFYVAGHYLLRMLKIDDPTDSSVVHGFVGIWGLW